MNYHIADGFGGQWLAETGDDGEEIGIGLVDTILREAGEAGVVVQRVVDLWNKRDGWIPGAAYEELAEALGVSTDRLVHLNGETRTRYYPEGTQP